MTWTIIIILIAVILYFVSNQKNNKSIEQHHIKKGGFRKSFPILTDHLKTFYGMSFVNDTGRSCTYSKNVNDTNGKAGQLIIGVKLDMRDEPIIFSKFNSSYKGVFSGMDVTGVDYRSIKSIDKCVNISIDKIKEQGVIDYEHKKNNLTRNKPSPVLIEEWNEINAEFSDSEIGKELDTLVNDFYIPYLIAPQNFMENLDILNEPWKGLQNEYGTESVKNIHYIPPIFSKFFIAAYPDVYQWYQENAQTGKIESHNKLEKLSDYESQEFIENPVKINEFYRNLINQFKKEDNELETKK